MTKKPVKTPAGWRKTQDGFTRSFRDRAGRLIRQLITYDGEWWRLYISVDKNPYIPDGVPTLTLENSIEQADETRKQLLDTKNPGAAWHEAKEREARRMDEAATKQWQKDFYHGKAVAHMESAIASRAMGENQPVTAYGVTRTPTVQQEWYATGTGDARRRARQLRALGYRVVTSSSDQITPVGRVKMTLLTVFNPDDALPPPDRVERLNPQRPPKRWFESCVRQVKQRSPRVKDPKAVCGALWYHKASPAAKRAALRRERHNPLVIYGLGNPGARVQARVEGVIYNRVLEIRAEKTGYKPGLYRHPFSRAAKVCLLALDNGDILVHSRAGKKLWKVDR